MRADVSTLGFSADLGSAGPSPSAPVDPYDALAGAPAGDHVVLAWLPGVAGGARALATARALVGRRDLAVVLVDGPGRPEEALLSTAVGVAAVLRSAPDDVPLAALAALARATARTLLSWTVVPSVTGLTRPAPSLWQHALSWVPGTRFTVDVAGGRVDRGCTTDGVRIEPGAPALAWVAHSGATGRAWAEQLLTQLGVRAHDASALGAAPRTARPRVEVSVLTARPALLLASPDVSHLERCRGCDRPTPAGTCPFCGHHRAAPAAGTTATFHTQELPA